MVPDYPLVRYRIPSRIAGAAWREQENCVPAPSERRGAALVAGAVFQRIAMPPRLAAHEQDSRVHARRPAQPQRGTDAEFREKGEGLGVDGPLPAIVEARARRLVDHRKRYPVGETESPQVRSEEEQIAGPGCALASRRTLTFPRSIFKFVVATERSSHRINNNELYVALLDNFFQLVVNDFEQAVTMSAILNQHTIQDIRA